ncbi:MAG: hypothetical protein NTU49_07050 [Gammaproteobacteria bacterium]|nr:hypothetical protein [Gammaproteobacteria bacterium]
MFKTKKTSRPAHNGQSKINEMRESLEAFSSENSLARNHPGQKPSTSAITKLGRDSFFDNPNFKGKIAPYTSACNSTQTSRRGSLMEHNPNTDNEGKMAHGF